MRRLTMFTAGLLCIFGVLSPAFPCQQVEPGQGYAEVTAEDVTRLEFNHYFDDDKVHHEADFVWKFAEDGTFEVRAGEGPIAAHLRKHLLGELMDVETIKGKWEVRQGRGCGTIVVFSEIAADDGEPSTELVALNIYRTAPTVIRMGDPQYVFALAQG